MASPYLIADNPSLADLIEAAFRSRMAEIPHALPGVVVSYDPATQSATVRPCVRFKRVLESGEEEAYQPPAIGGVPVGFYNGGNTTYSITFPIEPGDLILIVFLDRSIEEYLDAASATAAADVTPSDNRRFSLQDCYAIPIGRPFKAAIPSGDIKADALRINAGNAYIEVKNAEVVVDATTIKLGASATEALLKSTFGSFFNSHTHNITVASLGVPTPTLPPTVPYTGADNTTKVKGQ